MSIPDRAAPYIDPIPPTSVDYRQFPMAEIAERTHVALGLVRVSRDIPLGEAYEVAGKLVASALTAVVFEAMPFHPIHPDDRQLPAVAAAEDAARADATDKIDRALSWVESVWNV